MNELATKIATLWPEVAMLSAATLCLFAGLSCNAGLRRATAGIAAVGLIIAGILAELTRGQGPNADIAAYIKLAVAGVGLLLLMVAAAVPGQLRQTRDADAAPARRFEPGDTFRGEFFAFFLLSLTGVMLTAGSSDLVWMFLALELTSLPTYVLVAIGRDRAIAQESGVKYFFLGAMAAAVFLYGFTLIYGATGTTVLFSSPDEPLSVQQWALAAGTAGDWPPLFVLGLVLTVVGIAFKIAAFPMHFYAADVYEGANVSVTAFLAFVPKAAGFVALILIFSTVGWPLPPAVAGLVAVIAAITMTVGNVLGLVQHSVKRVLAYSSIAHSGYMLVGLLAGPHAGTDRGAVIPTVTVLGDGVGGVLFYLVAYGLATLAAFAVLGCIPPRGPEDEAVSFADLAGLSRRQPTLAAIMLLSLLSLIGLPPLIGFLGKLYLFAPAVSEGWIGLVVIAVLNSAISAVYYLRIVKACYFDAAPGDATGIAAGATSPARVLAAGLAAAAALVLGVAGQRLVSGAHDATAGIRPPAATAASSLPVAVAE